VKRFPRLDQTRASPQSNPCRSGKTAVFVELDLVEPFVALRQLVDQPPIHRLLQPRKSLGELCYTTNFVYTAVTKVYLGLAFETLIIFKFLAFSAS
jgi:hypothetical protein